MKTLVLGWEEVEKLLPMSECVEVMKGALKTMARGDVIQPSRTAVVKPDRTGRLGMMPAYLGDPPLLGVKAVSVFSGNLGTKFESHQGTIQLFEPEHGKLEAIVDAGSVTAIRTGAVSAVATEVLANKNTDSLAILGSGTQAGIHLEAMLLHNKKFQSVKVWSRNQENANRFAKRESKRFGIDIQTFDTAEEAVRGADLICTTTASTSPILKGAWLSPGVHINAIGSSFPPFRELDTQAVAKSSFFVDRRQSAIEEADDFRIPKSEGVIDDSHIRGEIGEILIGKIQGRKNKEELTIFKSLGLAIEDLAAAYHVYK